MPKKTDIPNGVEQADFLFAEQYSGIESHKVRIVSETERSAKLFPKYVGRILDLNLCYRTVHLGRGKYLIQPVKPKTETRVRVVVMPEFSQASRDFAIRLMAWQFLVSQGLNGPSLDSDAFREAFADGYLTDGDILRVVNDLLGKSGLELQEEGQSDLAGMHGRDWLRAISKSLEITDNRQWCHPDACPYREMVRGDVEFPDPVPRCERCGMLADHDSAGKGFRRNKR